MKEKRSLMLVLTAAVLWGAAGVFVRSLNTQGISEMQTVFSRAVFAIIIYGIIIFIRNKNLFKIHFKDLWAFIGIGVLSIAMFNYCYYKTMRLSTLSVAAVLLYTAPFFVVLLSRILFKEAITPKKSIACIIAFIGCCFVAGIFTSGQAISSKCIMFGLLTGFGYGLYTIFGNILIAKGYQTLTINFYAFVFAALSAFPLSNPLYTAKTVALNPKALLLLIGMAIINTVLPYLAYTAALKHIEGGKALIIATLEPVVATLLGVVIFKEALNLHSIVGIILVLGSVIILNLKKRDKNEGFMQCEN